MARDYGVNTTMVTEDSLLGDHPPIIKSGTILSGEDLTLGAVLAVNSDGKNLGLDLETEVETEELVADAGGATQVFEGFLANGGVVPGSVTISATVGAAAKTMTDNGKGKLAGAGVGVGTIDYASGYYWLSYSTAPDDDTAVAAAYSHDAAGQAVAVGVLLEAIDASEADEAGLVLLHGVVNTDDLVWPDSITADQKARALNQLAAAGIHAL